MSPRRTVGEIAAGTRTRQGLFAPETCRKADRKLVDVRLMQLRSNASALMAAVAAGVTFSVSKTAVACASYRSRANGPRSDRRGEGVTTVSPAREHAAADARILRFGGVPFSHEVRMPNRGPTLTLFIRSTP